MSGGQRGLKTHLETQEFSIGAGAGLGPDTHLRALVGFVLQGLYPPYTWIPAQAGMTRYGACRGAKPLCRGFGGVPHFELSGVPLWQRGTEGDLTSGPEGLTPATDGPVVLTYFSADTRDVITKEGRHHNDAK